MVGRGAGLNSFPYASSILAALTRKLMKPFIHSKNSVTKWGGNKEDYQAIHDFIDSSKACHPDVRHRAILHSSFGCFLVEKIFGITIKNSDGKDVSVRDIAEAHIIEDLGFIPRVDHWLKNMPIQDWMYGSVRAGGKKRFIPAD